MPHHTVGFNVFDALWAHHLQILDAILYASLKQLVQPWHFLWLHSYNQLQQDGEAGEVYSCWTSLNWLFCTVSFYCLL